MLDGYLLVDAHVHAARLRSILKVQLTERTLPKCGSRGGAVTWGFDRHYPS